MKQKRLNLAPEIKLAAHKKQKMGCGPACKPIEDEEEEKCIPEKPARLIFGCSPSCSPDSGPCGPDSGPCGPDDDD